MLRYIVSIRTTKTNLEFVSTQPFLKVKDIITRLLKDDDIVEINVYSEKINSMTKDNKLIKTYKGVKHDI